ncbi:hypothetical protein KBC75_03235 [Candidatus Shapirobacteria bacterium]|nr:hypothetical protein [Candidatus Shapirobacteria bacterium]
MENYIEKIGKFMDRLAEIAGMNEVEKKDFFDNYNEGLMTYLLADGQKFVSTATFDALKNTPVKENLDKYFQEMATSSEGSTIIEQRVLEMVEDIIDAVREKLTDDQKEELLGILI